MNVPVIGVGSAHVKVFATGASFKFLKKMPEGCRAGDNAKAFLGVFRRWHEKGRQR